jgi:predicted ferric reductase
MTWWYINRAAGLVAWALLSASIVFGLLLSSKALGKKVRPNWIQDLHRGLSGLAVVFVGVHVAGAIGDTYIHFGAADVLVPFASGWRPIAVAWGVVSAYLLIAVELSSLLRKHISKSAWRKIHFLSFPLFLTATAHGITAGTEFGTTVGIGIAALVTAAIAGLTTLRVISEVEKAKQPPAPRIAAPRVTAPRTVVTLSEPVSPYPDIDLAPPTWLQPPAPARPEPDAAPVRTGRAF